jgi:proteasome component ECM29
MEIFVHINKRIKSRPNVQLPLDELLSMFNDPAYTNMAFFANFSLIYIKHGFPRLDNKNKAIMIERLLNSLEGKSNPHMDA